MCYADGWVRWDITQSSVISESNLVHCIMKQSYAGPDLETVSKGGWQVLDISASLLVPGWSARQGLCQTKENIEESNRRDNEHTYQEEETAQSHGPQTMLPTPFTLMFQVTTMVWTISINCCVLSLCLLTLTAITTMWSLQTSLRTRITSLDRLLPPTNRKTWGTLRPPPPGEGAPGSVRWQRKLSERGETPPMLGRGRGWTRWREPTAGSRRSSPTTKTLIPRSRLWIRSDHC